MEIEGGQTPAQKDKGTRKQDENGSFGAQHTRGSNTVPHWTSLFIYHERESLQQGDLNDICGVNLLQVMVIGESDQEEKHNIEEERKSLEGMLILPQGLIQGLTEDKQKKGIMMDVANFWKMGDKQAENLPKNWCYAEKDQGQCSNNEIVQDQERERDKESGDKGEEHSTEMGSSPSGEQNKTQGRWEDNDGESSSVESYRGCLDKNVDESF
uniref:Uncharacterized protein n=1 Tax=Arundo donax TaxID=35708 RepID=A0A0A9GNH6_ARUDO